MYEHVCSSSFFESPTYDLKIILDFKDKTSVVNTLHNYIDTTKDTIHFSLSSGIVDVIIGDIFFRDDEVLIDIDDDDDDADAAATIL